MVLTILKMDNKQHGVGMEKINPSFCEKQYSDLVRLKTKYSVYKYCTVINKFVFHKGIG